MAAVVVKGYQQLLRDLKDVEPGLRKETMQAISKAAATARTKARGFLPDDPGMSGWDKANYREGSRWFVRGYNAREARAGVRVKRGQSKPDRSGYRNEIGVENSTFGGIIYELAGSKSNGMDARGTRFIDNIASTGLRKPLRRVVIRAVIEEGPAIRRSIAGALDRVERRFNRRQAVPR